MAETSKESKKETPDDMSFRNESVKIIGSLVNENKKMREAMTASAAARAKADAESKKTKRRESAASRIQGLQTVKNTLGSPTKPNYKK
jgi:hypothetical protein